MPSGHRKQDRFVPGGGAATPAAIPAAHPRKTSVTERRNLPAHDRFFCAESTPHILNGKGPVFETPDFFSAHSYTKQSALFSSPPRFPPNFARFLSLFTKNGIFFSCNLPISVINIKFYNLFIVVTPIKILLYTPFFCAILNIDQGIQGKTT